VVISVAGGILSGVASLAFSSVLPQQLHDSTRIASIAIFVLIEECAKIIAVWAILKSFSLREVISAVQLITLSLLVGFGFGLFEFFLILLGADVSINALKPMFIHLATGLFIGIAFYLLIIKLRYLSVIFFMLSLAIHLCYNAFVAMKHF
jgi:hypothetical protein